MASRSGVYSIENTLNGRRYVGSAVDIEKRWREHRRGLDAGTHHSRFLLREWRKSGADAFRFRVLLWCDRCDVLMFEQRFLDAWGPEYNTAPTAGSQLGYRHTPEARAKQAEAARRTRNFTGHRHSDETKRRIAEKKRGVTHAPHSDATRAKIGAAHRGRPRSPEYRAKISATLTGRVQPRDVVQKRADSNRGRKWSDEERAMRAARGLTGRRARG